MPPSEPLVERRIGVVEHRVPLLKPVQPLGLLDPPSLGVARRLLIDRRVFQQRVLAKPGRRVERLDIEQAGKLPVERIADRRLRSTRHGYRPPNGITGRTVRPNVELVTAANDAYQAAAAVARPR